MLRCLSFLLTLLFASLLNAQTLTIAAAVSLKESVTALGQEYQHRTGVPIEFAFGASGQLLAQIRSGAPIDGFISAAPQQMDELAKENLLFDGTRSDIVTNTLVLIAPPGSNLGGFEQLTDDSVRRVAIGQPKTVPAGTYGQQTLQSLHLYDSLQPKLLFGTNVRQVLDYVITGNADAGLVYGTDAKEAGDKVRVVAAAPASSHEPIVYPGAVLKRSPHADAAKAFLSYLQSPEAQSVFASRGFGPPPTTAPSHP